MNEGLIDHAFWAFAAAVAAFALLLPNKFIYLASYGGRLKHRPSNLMVAITRGCAVVMLLGATVELLR